MKKLIFALPLLALPLTAMAQDKPTQASQETINDMAKTMTGAICKNGLDGAATAVYDCYQHTPDTSPDIEKCMIADMSITLRLLNDNQKAQALGQPVKNIPFFNENTVNQRIEKYLKLPKYKNYTEKEKANYLYNSQKAMGQEIIKLQKNNYCEKK